MRPDGHETSHGNCREATNTDGKHNTQRAERREPEPTSTEGVRAVSSLAETKTHTLNHIRDPAVVPSLGSYYDLDERQERIGIDFYEDGADQVDDFLKDAVD